MFEETSSINGPTKPVLIDHPVGASDTEYRDLHEVAAKFHRG
jgi:hypothetical protein